MNIIHSTVVGLCSILLVTAAQASVYSTGFDEGVPFYDVGAALAGQDGWTVNDANTDVSYFASLNGSNAGILGGGGGGYFPPTSQTSVKLSHAHSGLLVGSVFSVDFAILKSTGAHPNNDSFNFFFSAGTDLFVLSLEPSATEADQLEIVWYINGSPTRNSGSTNSNIYYEGLYTLGLSFGASGADATFNASLITVGAPLSTMTWGGTLPGDAASSLTSFGVGWNLANANPANAGDNFIVFDNLSLSHAVPEPSVLALGMLSLGFFSKRRRNRP